VRQGVRALIDLLWPRRGERLLPAVAAVLLASSFPPLHPLVPPFVGLVPFALWVHGLSPDARGRRSAVRGSLVFGTLYFGILFYWILVALIWFTWMAVLAFIGSMILLVGAAALFGWMLHRAIHTVRAPLWLALPVTWTATEWFRAQWPGPLAVPWLGLGTSLTGFPELVGIAEIVGARGVTFWLALVNGLLAVLVLRVRRSREGPTAAGGARGGRGWWPLAAVTLATVVLPMAWGVWRARTLQMRDVGRVAVVQPNIPEDLKMDAEASRDSTFASLDRLMARIPPGSVKLVVLPEVTFQILPKHPNYAAEVGRIQDYSREVGAPILFGALGYSYGDGGEFIPYNSAFLMKPQGLTDYEYDKRYLVPMVERVPLLPAKWLRHLQYFGKFGVGKGWPLAEVDETAFAPLVCYESTYPEGARQFRLAGADVLLNITNDSWYGREPWWSRTTALWQHPAHLVMRAIENRMGVARAANTGISLFVDPVGRVYDATHLFQPAVEADDVYTTDVLTFYTRFGDLTGDGAAAAALILVLASFRLGKGNRPSLDPVEDDG
jgi:apolipoprotein N-acyltransferase